MTTVVSSRMVRPMDDVVTDHRRACRGFSAVVSQGEGRWTSPSPCAEWDAAGVVEHVIGFHDELLLRPTGTKPVCPKDDPKARWAVTVSAMDSAMELASSNDHGDPHPPAEVDLGHLLPALTAEVLAHTWDLAEAMGVDPHLDTGLCEASYALMQANEEQMRSSGMFGPAVPVRDDADSATLLIAFLGRDPDWRD